MSFLGFGGSSYNRPGPGIPKGAPQKKGSALFLDILSREFWSLLTLNLIYSLACLPIITIGPATAALSRVTVTMVRDENVYPWRDFWDAFRKNIKQGLGFGIPATFFFFGALWLNLTVLTTENGTLWTAFIFLWTFFGVALCCYIFPLVAYVALPWAPLLKNALYLTVLGKFRTAAAALVSILTAAVSVAALPIFPLVMIFCGGFAFLSLFNAFMVWPVIDKFVLHKDELTEPSAQ
ncbi:MAG: YesL family protein [Angelakisella sp.]